MDSPRTERPDSSIPSGTDTTDPANRALAQPNRGKRSKWVERNFDDYTNALFHETAIKKNLYRMDTTNTATVHSFSEAAADYNLAQSEYGSEKYYLEQARAIKKQARSKGELTQEHRKVYKDFRKLADQARNNARKAMREPCLQEPDFSNEPNIEKERARATAYKDVKLQNWERLTDPNRQRTPNDPINDEGKKLDKAYVQLARIKLVENARENAKESFKRAAAEKQIRGGPFSSARYVIAEHKRDMEEYDRSIIQIRQGRREASDYECTSTEESDGSGTESNNGRRGRRSKAGSAAGGSNRAESGNGKRGQLKGAKAGKRSGGSASSGSGSESGNGGKNKKVQSRNDSPTAVLRADRAARRKSQLQSGS